MTVGVGLVELGRPPESYVVGEVPSDIAAQEADAEMRMRIPLESSARLRFMLDLLTDREEIQATIGLALSTAAEDDEQCSWLAQTMARYVVENPLKSAGVHTLMEMVEQQVIQELGDAHKRGEEGYRSPLEKLQARYERHYQDRMNANAYMDGDSEVWAAPEVKLNRRTMIKRAARHAGRTVKNFFIEPAHTRYDFSNVK